MYEFLEIPLMHVLPLYKHEWIVYSHRGILLWLSLYLLEKYYQLKKQETAVAKEEKTLDTTTTTTTA